jgi:hypothetical protein
MKQYILINRVPAEYGQNEAKVVAEAWKLLTDQWKAAENFVISFVFPGAGSIATGHPANVLIGNVLSENLKIVSVIVVKAEDMEQAAQLASLSPILRQSGSVEIKEIMDRPVRQE